MRVWPFALNMRGGLYAYACYDFISELSSVNFDDLTI